MGATESCAAVIATETWTSPCVRATEAVPEAAIAAVRSTSRVVSHADGAKAWRDEAVTAEFSAKPPGLGALAAEAAQAVAVAVQGAAESLAVQSERRPSAGPGAARIEAAEGIVDLC
jgi:hypothetical protein